MNTIRKLKLTSKNDISKFTLFIKKNEKIQVEKFKSKNISRLVIKLSESFFKKRIITKRLSDIPEKAAFKDFEDFKDISFEELSESIATRSLINKFS